MVLEYLAGLISSKTKPDKESKKSDSIETVKKLCNEKLPDKSKSIAADISAEWKDMSSQNNSDVDVLDQAMKTWAVDKIEALREDKKGLEELIGKIKETITKSDNTNLPSTTELKIMQIVNSNPIKVFTGKESVTNLLFYFHQTAETYFSKYRIEQFGITRILMT